MAESGLTVSTVFNSFAYLADGFKMPFVFLGNSSIRLELKLCLRFDFWALGKVLGLELLSSELLMLIPEELLDELPLLSLINVVTVLLFKCCLIFSLSFLYCLKLP